MWCLDLKSFLFLGFLFSGNQIGDEGAARLATCLESNSSITSLNMGGWNRIFGDLFERGKRRAPMEETKIVFGF